ncbi:MAG: mannosyltransferase [Mycobacterium sp.]|jgi:hypothetical protein|nr:mannosyltransferase [Mycobacterium sp.]
MRPRSDHQPFGQLTPWRKRPPRRNGDQLQAVACERTRDSRLLLWQSTILANSTMRSGSIVIQCAQRSWRIHQKRATWANIEARPYALSMTAALWLTVLLVRAERQNTAGVWLAYGVVLATSILLDVNFVLLLAVR